MEMTYSEVNGYMIPNLTAPEEAADATLTRGRFALKRRAFLKNHRKILFTNLLTAGKLNEHLVEIEQTARARFALIVSQMAADRCVTEELKAADQMKWVGLMNNIRHSAEELILNDLIYS